MSLPCQSARDGIEKFPLCLLDTVPHLVFIRYDVYDGDLDPYLIACYGYREKIFVISGNYIRRRQFEMYLIGLRVTTVMT